LIDDDQLREKKRPDRNLTDGEESGAGSRVDTSDLFI
jgi:hypothetical protein